MNWKYKAVMFLTLLIFCVGSVCATEPNNTTNTNLTDNQKVNNGLDTIITTCNLLKEDNAKQAIEIQNLKDNNTQLDKRIKALEDSNKVLTDKVQALEYSKLTQSNRIKSLEIDVQNLEESNKQLINSNKLLIDSNKLLIDSNKQKDIDIKELKDSNKILNTTVNNQTVKINELNNKLELQINEIKQLQADKDKLNAEIKENYKKLLESPKKEDYEQLKKDIADKDNKIKELNTKIKILNNILNINKKDVVNSLKALSSTNIQNIKCGKYTFKLEDYLKIPLIKNGKNDIVKFKKDNGRLPKYVIIGDYKVPKNVYQKLYNL